MGAPATRPKVINAIQQNATEEAFTPDRVSRWLNGALSVAQCTSALNNLHNSHLPGLEKISSGVYKYTLSESNKDAEGLRIIKHLADVDGRELVQDTETNLVYWLTPVNG